MAHDPAPAAPKPPLWSGLRTFGRPWPILLAGLTCTVVGLMLSTTTSATPVYLLTLGAGVLLAGAAVARRLQTASQELEDRVESAGLVALASLVAGLAFLGTHKNWESAALFLGALFAVGLSGALLVLLPWWARRTVLSVLLVIHFGGILTACSAVAPREEPAPWLSRQVWVHFYRPYLVFMYLTNAYHFYSPDPGPPSLLWFRIEYADHQHRWFKLPVRKESPVALHHQRMLALAESTNQPMGIPLTAEQIPEWEERYHRPYQHESWNEIWERRQMGARTHPAIQLAADVLPGNQYSEPNDLAKKLLGSYARHVALTSPHPKYPQVPVVNVRVYRVTHQLISPGDLANGKDPLDPTTYLVYYMGKFDTKGELQDPKDPFLYWYLPIAVVDRRYPEPGTAIRVNAPPPGGFVLNCVDLQTGDATLDELKAEQR
jgi:hypothetical protein